MKVSPPCALFLLGLLLLSVCGCASSSEGPRELLDKYFSSAMKQDYATTYTCYYKAYQQRVTAAEFIKNRKKASLLLSYKILSLQQDGITAKAEVELTFGPSEKLNRKEPVTITVREDMVKENGEWKIRVW